MSTAEVMKEYPPTKMPPQLRAVLTMFAAECELYNLVSPHINLYERSIDWEKIFGLGLHAGHRAVCDWAYIAWRDEVPEGARPFDSVFSADPQFRTAILRGLAIRWAA